MDRDLELNALLEAKRILQTAYCASSVVIAGEKVIHAIQAIDVQLNAIAAEMMSDTEVSNAL